MKPYLLALALGLLVGVIYGLFKVRSPAPPVVALVGLLGILLGEQLPPLVRQLLEKPGPAAAAAPAASAHAVWLRHQVKPHMFGSLPCRTPPVASSAPISATTPGDSTHG